MKIPQAAVATRQVIPSNVDRERRALDIFAVVLDGDKVLAGHHGSIPNLIALVDLVTREVDLGGSVDGDGQGSGANTRCVNDEG